MTHLGFIAASYAVAVILPAIFAVDAALRVGRARRILAAIDHRAQS